MVISYEVSHFISSRFNHDTCIRQKLSSLQNDNTAPELRNFFLLVDEWQPIVGSNCDLWEMYCRCIETKLRSIHDNPSSTFTLTSLGLHSTLTYISNIPWTRWCMKASNTISYVTLGKEKILESRETVPMFSFEHFALCDTTDVIHFVQLRYFHVK